MLLRRLTMHTRDPKLSHLLPAELAQALRLAAQRKDYDVIDRITDHLARMGLCRPRDDDRRTPR